MRVLVKEGNTLLECECPVNECEKCSLRFKCYTSHVLTDLSLEEKTTLLWAQNLDNECESIEPIRILSDANESLHNR